MQVLQLRCVRCGKDITANPSKKQFKAIWVCMFCLFQIVEEWKIKRDEIAYLGQGREFCGSNNCTYEINHIGKHSWETL